MLFKPENREVIIKKSKAVKKGNKCTCFHAIYPGEN
jgi:hypothetical protein